jgi:hypothetical protein
MHLFPTNPQRRGDLASDGLEGPPMNDLLGKLQITTWYKAVLAGSIPAFLIVLAAQRDTLTILFGGITLIALGEWKNHPKKEAQYRPIVTGRAALITDVPRRWTVAGTAMQFVGAALLIYSALLPFGISLPSFLP